MFREAQGQVLRDRRVRYWSSPGLARSLLGPDPPAEQGEVVDYTCELRNNF